MKAALESTDYIMKPSKEMKRKRINIQISVTQLLNIGI